ncbi:hypothetical protein EDB92DRAFT_1819096 [Lactarius akahatsu]|uniref:Uncharacterized protein n=1 Tax=Lactarius akahatsu TaxID=416441 RepID=A0AAD4LAB9_9AGAM|nr:hypothetical protein EDB92DRAFT_1819096 [Lactarius akahatsu]
MTESTTITYEDRQSTTRFDGVAASLGEWGVGRTQGPSHANASVLARAVWDVEQVNGGGDHPNDPGNKANLNIQVTQGISYQVQHPRLLQLRWLTAVQTRWQLVNKLELAAPRLDKLDYLHDLQGSRDDEQTVPEDYAKGVCSLFARFSLRGVGVLFASGDSGVGGGDYMANDDSGKDRFLPIFPVSYPHPFPGPWVTTSVDGGVPDGAVKAFLEKLGDTYDGLYNPGGRGIPDIAAQSTNYYQIVFRGDPLGFLNPGCTGAAWPQRYYVWLEPGLQD